MLHRRITLLQAVSLNMAMMVGMGPFITIPLLVGKLGGPHALLGWVIGALVALCDGLVWCELATAFPGSGGTFHFFDAVFRRAWLGRLLRFLFVWQFLVSAPLELASGGIGLGQYAGFLWPQLRETVWSLNLPISDGLRWTWVVNWGQILAVALVLGAVALAYRRIEVAGRLMVVLWVGMLVTMAWMIGTGVTHFDPRLAWDLPPDAWRLDHRFAVGLGGALAIAMYDYLGYYQVCYLGDEVIDPERTLPRAVLFSVVVVSAMYLTMNLGILGVVPWSEVITSPHIASDFMERALGGRAAIVVTALILWTGSAALFAGLIGYSRVPYAAALTGNFFRGLARTHPTGEFPHRCLLLIGTLTALACLFDLPTVIAALLASRILIQFVAQIGTVCYLRSSPALSRRLRFRIALFPLPALIALLGWLWVFGTTESLPLVFAVLSMGLGGLAFLVWDWLRSRNRSTAS